MNPKNCELTGICQPKQWGPSIKCKWCHVGLDGMYEQPKQTIKWREREREREKRGVKFNEY